MNPILDPLLHLTRLQLLLVHGLAALRERVDRDDRGDVPGWVMVTVMTAGLCAALFKFAGPQLKRMLSSAFDQVR